jgi:hypothetical protein
MDYFVVFVLGMAASMMILRWVINRTIVRLVGEIDRELSAKSTEADTGPKLKVELDQNTYFTYNIANNQFVCQGSSVQQLRERLSEMFPGQTATIVEGDPAVLAVIQQELERTK